MDELSSARATAPRPIGATAKLGSSIGESADTKVSIACTRRGVVPSIAAAAAAPSSPISSRTLQMPQRDELRGRADAVVERPARRAGPREADVLLRHGYRLPGADAPGHGFGARSGTHVDAERGRGVAREARVTRQEDARDVTLVRVHQRRLGLEERGNESAAGLELERAVVADPGHPEADFVQVRDDYHHRAPLADSHPQVARGVGLALGPTGQQAFHRLPYRTLGAGDAVRLHQLGENRLRLGDSSGVLGGKTVKR